MATRRQRRVIAHDPEADRGYAGEDYAVQPTGTLPDEWNSAASGYPQAGWTGETFLPDEAFQPDETDAPEEGEWAIGDSFAPYEEEPYQPLFDGTQEFTDELDPLADELLTEEEQAELKRSHWQLVAGLMDFVGVIAGTAAILILVTLLVSLLNWLINDMSQSFILLQKNL